MSLAAPRRRCKVARKVQASFVPSVQSRSAVAHAAAASFGTPFPSACMAARLTQAFFSPRLHAIR